MSEYEKVSLIVEVASAVATFAAVCVALWQTYYPNRKKLKLDFSPYTFTVGNLIQNEKYYISLSVVNIGPSTVFVSGWSIEFENGQCMVILPSGFGDPILDRQLYVDTPHELCPNSKVTFFTLQESFFNELKKLIEKGELKGTDKLTIVVSDTTGKKYKIKSQDTVEKMLGIG